MDKSTLLTYHICMYLHEVCVCCASITSAGAARRVITTDVSATPEPSAVRFASKATCNSCHIQSNDFVRSLLSIPSREKIICGSLMWNRSPWALNGMRTEVIGLQKSFICRSGVREHFRSFFERVHLITKKET